MDHHGDSVGAEVDVQLERVRCEIGGLLERRHGVLRGLGGRPAVGDHRALRRIGERIHNQQT